MEQGIYVGAGGRRGIQVRSGAGKRGRFLKCELKGQFRAVLLVLGNSFAMGFQRAGHDLVTST